MGAMAGQGWWDCRFDRKFGLPIPSKWGKYSDHVTEVEQFFRQGFPYWNGRSALLFLTAAAGTEGGYGL
jgi:hypothetical protein